MNIKNYKTAVVLAIFCTLLWGTAFPFIKLGYAQFDIADTNIGSKLLFAGARFTIAGLAVLLTSSIKSKQLERLTKKDILPVVLLGLIQTFGQYIFTYIGIGFTSSTNTSLITACSSFFAVLFAPFFFRQDKLTAAKIAGCAVGFCGVLIVNTGGGVSLDTLLGDALILLSTISATAGNFVSKGVVQGRNPLTVTGFQLSIGGLLLALCGLIFGGKLDFSNIYGILILLWLALVSAVAFAIWTALLKYHDASKICVFNLLVPVFGTLLSGVMLSEDVFSVNTFLSLALICAGIFLVSKQWGDPAHNPSR
ncbi:MAG: DMT family transporter [Ruminococcus sp.]|nr:DMT family transporter [Ruminococcus sp.]